MVPLRLDVCKERLFDHKTEARPHLVLQDMSEDVSKNLLRKATAPRRAGLLPKLENLVLAASLAAVLLFFFCGFAQSLIHSVQQRYLPSNQTSVLHISATVKRGDTLARLAQRYGDPNIYLLKREDQIARANHLSGTAPLFPGQHLQIPVTNPVVIARIQQQQRIAHR